MKKFTILLSLIIIILGLLQFIPLKRPGGKNAHELQASKEVKDILKRSCYDCHSDLTRWPWYSKVFPISLLVIHDVKEGKEFLNFSEWESLSLKQKSNSSFEIIEEIESKEMPLKIYLPLHPEAKLSSKDIDLLKKWADEIDLQYAESKKNR
ncbi:MAG: heme-binding domain-containing protein [Leptospiraceae bacterium]|nr:heme-binding domain-containing protein [Leptospiraceae bacterium]MCP5500770.1 heme-binding domain-containing protein [Leptospiraceae bacterium]